MTRILVRSGKDPFDVVSPHVTLRDNVIGNNVGNLVFSNAVHKLLTTSRTDTVSTRFRADARDAPQINAEFSAFAIPLANAFRPGFADALDRLSELIEKLTIPVVVVGVGAQATMGGRSRGGSDLERRVKRFASAVLDRSATIGVRGEFTGEYLNTLGFRDVDVIGCPSLFMYGPNLRVEHGPASLDPAARVALNISPYVSAMGPITMANEQQYPGLDYIAQDNRTLRLMLTRIGPVRDNAAPGMPVDTSHPLYRKHRMRFCVDPQTWFDLLRGYQFSFGTRIHGNIAAILAGTPAMLLAHDSRTLELARYHEIPRRSVRKLPPDVRAADLYEQVDYTAFNAGHRARWEQFAAFLIRNGLPHVYEPGEDPSAFDARMAVTDFPAPVGVTSRAQAWMNRLRTDSPVRRLARRMLQRSDDQQPPPRGP